MNDSYTVPDALADALANARVQRVPEVYPLHVSAELDGTGADILPFVKRHGAAVPGAAIPDWGITLEPVLLAGDEPTVNIFATFVVQHRAALGALWHRLTAADSGANPDFVNVIPKPAEAR